MNTFVKQPRIETNERKAKVEIMEPSPNNNISLNFISSLVVLEAKTPVQKIIVSGFETVNKIALINGFVVITGMADVLGVEILIKEVTQIYKPNIINTNEPKYFKIFSKLEFFSISLPIPNIARIIYNASTKVTPKVPINEEVKPVVIDN